MSRQELDAKMDTKGLLQEALHLSPAEKLRLIECLVHSLDKPDDNIEKIWAAESEKRYQALKDGKTKTIPLNEVIQMYQFI